MDEDMERTALREAERRIADTSRRERMAEKVKELRVILKTAGVAQTSFRVPEDTKEWWTAQANIAAGAALYDFVIGSKAQPSLANLLDSVANLRITPQPSLAVAALQASKPAQGLEALSTSIMRETKLCVDTRERGYAAMELGDTTDATEHFAAEYALSMKIRGMQSLYNYLSKGGVTPELFNV